MQKNGIKIRKIIEKYKPYIGRSDKIEDCSYVFIFKEREKAEQFREEVESLHLGFAMISNDKYVKMTYKPVYKEAFEEGMKNE